MEQIKTVPKIFYRNIKYPRLEYKTGELVMILPAGVLPFDLLNRHKKWIKRKSDFIGECLSGVSEKEIVDRSDKEFRQLTENFICGSSKSLGVDVNKVFYRKMKTKWASCSSNKNITINNLMKLLPDALIEYVLFHELCHLIEKRHSKLFWKLISSKFNNYNYFEKELFTYWFLIQEKLLDSSTGGSL